MKPRLLAAAIATTILCGAGAAPLGGAQLLPPPRLLPPAAVDDDHDGIDDALEQFLAERYAPILYLEPGESNYPVNVDWIMQRGHLWYGEEGCTPDFHDPLFGTTIGGLFRISTQTIGSQSLLIGPSGASGLPWTYPDNFSDHPSVTECGSDDARRLTTTQRLPEHFGDDQLWYIGNAGGGDLDDSDRLGSLDPHDWVTYFHVYPTDDGGVMIQYWHTFAFNQFEAVDAHGGDWDASIQVKLDGALTLQRVFFSRHDDDHPGKDFAPGQVRLFGGTHPVVTVDGGGHAAYRSPDDWATCDCTAFSDVTGPIGTIVWTNDTDPFDNPDVLRKVGFICNPQTNVCTLSLLDLSGGTVWKTWTDGDVRQSGGDHRLVVNPSRHGGLINLGEYNPNDREASQLLAGQFFPLNGQVFIEYSGRWGTTNSFASDGPRGPVFQGLNGGTYTSWYNRGGNDPADASNSPWRAGPTTTLAVGNPAFQAANGATFVSSATPFTLNATESALAAQYASLLTFYRFFPVAGSAGSYVSYSGPFSISGADGTYAVNDFSLDGLNNQEDPIQAAVFSLDNTPPVTSIVQPAPTQYVHSATLVLDYAANDGTGAGVRNTTATMDGQTTLSGHGLASGQSIDLLTELIIGTHTFSVEAVDYVGNAATRSTTFEIIVTADSIKADVAHFVADGRITVNPNSFLAKLDTAAEQRANGNCTAAAGKYESFINELLAQRGKGVDPAAADIMIADAQYLIAHCPQ